MGYIPRKYRIGVIGAGARGETFARQLYSGHPRAELFGVCDLDAERLETFCRYCELGDAARYTNTQAFLNEGGLDAVIITTPEWTHADVAKQALAAGKHIYLEKPMAHTTADCISIIRAHEAASGTAHLSAFIGFNVRETAPIIKLKEVIDSGVLGKIVHISGLEQLARAHGAAFMRRFHRRSERSGGLMNHKCSHDLDILQWLIGHEHKVIKVASFGGCDIFTPNRQPATHCRVCAVKETCYYPDQAGFVFPVRGDLPLHHPKSDIYGGDLCVFNDDKDIIDNQTVIMEWDNGIRGSFNLQMFQHFGRRQICVWGETGYAEYSTWPDASVRVVAAGSGDTTEYGFAKAVGGHGGSDIKMISRFVEAIENPQAFDSSTSASSLSAGLAATLVASKADEARLSGTVSHISPAEYL